MRATATVSRLLAVVAAAIVTSASLSLISAAPAAASDTSGSALAVKTTSFADGSSVSARALSASEVKSRGLAPAGANIIVVAPSLVGADNGKIASPPVRKPAGGASTMSVACWSLWYQFGSDAPGTFADLWTRQTVFYCATDTWISSTSSSCYQFDGGYPTYEVLGCSNSEAYGIGWSAWDVRTVGNVCWNWIPGYGCLSNTTAIRKLRYNGFGQYSVIESVN